MFVDAEENENKFQEAQKNEDWDTMFLCMQVACRNICKSIYNKRGFEIQKVLLEDISLDATIMCMEGIKYRGGWGKIGKLSSYCYLPCLSIINRSDKWEKKLEKAVDIANTYYCSNNIEDIDEEEI